MYSVLPSFILGFHGCDKQVAEDVLAGKKRLRPSTNDYDWLGHGIYFWENNPQRALDYARAMKKNPTRCKEDIREPAVIGAVIDLGHCLNLLDSKNLEHIKGAYNLLKQAYEKSGLPKNKKVGKSKELLLRNLDCAVIQATHAIQKDLVKEGKAKYEFDTVRAVFEEGEKLYENSGFCERSHIQICVANHNCIKGYFRILQPDHNLRIP